MNHIYKLILALAFIVSGTEGNAKKAPEDGDSYRIYLASDIDDSEDGATITRMKKTETKQFKSTHTPTKEEVLEIAYDWIRERGLAPSDVNLVFQSGAFGKWVFINSVDELTDENLKNLFDISTPSRTMPTINIRFLSHHH